MTIITMKLPDLGEGVAEAELVEWNVEVGDRIAVDATLATVMTDKAAMEIPAPSSGVVLWRAGGPGEMLRVGSDLVRIDTEETATPGAQSEPADATSSAETPALPEDEPDENRGEAPGDMTDETEGHEAADDEPSANGHPPARHASQRPSPSRGDRSNRTNRPKAAPAVRRRAAEMGIDLAKVTGTGPGGRVLHEDLSRDRSNGPDTDGTAHETVREITLTGLRRMTAERVAAAKATIPHFTIVEEVNVTDLEALRAALNARHAESRGKLTILPFVLRALVLALRDHGGVNGTFDGDVGVLRLNSAVHAGIATQTEAGLMVPVLRHAERQGLWDTAAAIARLAERARQGRATREELTGSTITVTSLGILGGIASTPIINAPEIAIIGVNKIVTRPVWIDGEARPGQVMNLSCSFDHRVIDGWDAAVFLQDLRAWLEAPALMLAEAD